MTSQHVKVGCNIIMEFEISLLSWCVGGFAYKSHVFLVGERLPLVSFKKSGY